ncbi:MAG: hypothetical protein WAQ52_02280 [Terriglobales bacterium]
MTESRTPQLSKEGYHFAGGDIVTGSATVTLAMGAGGRAAKGIHVYLTTGTAVERIVLTVRL